MWVVQSNKPKIRMIRKCFNKKYLFKTVSRRRLHFKDYLSIKNDIISGIWLKPGCHRGTDIRIEYFYEICEETQNIEFRLLLVKKLYCLYRSGLMLFVSILVTHKSIVGMKSAHKENTSA